MTATLSPAEYRKTALSEHDIQVAITTYLDRVLPGYMRAVGVSNNPRSKVAGGREKARGMKRGFPDMLIIGDGFFAFMEVKKEGGRLSPEQREWRDWCGSHQVPYAVVRSVADVEETIKQWGLVKV